MSRLARRLHVVRRAVASSGAQEAALLDIVDGTTAVATRSERDVQCRHDYLGAALDILNSYQRAAEARPFFIRMDEARLRLVEVLKQWLRSHAGRDRLDEQTLRSMSKVVADVLREPELFASRQVHNLNTALTRVYDQLQRQLEVDLSRDRSSAKLMDDIMVHAKGMLSGTIAVLLLGPTHLVELDALPSLAPDVLRESLCGDLRGVMCQAWATDCGRVAAALVSMKLFTGKDAEAAHDEFRKAMLEIQPRFEGPGGESLLSSGLAGAFRSKEKMAMRKLYLAVTKATFELAYLFGDVLMPFHTSILDYGDYGAIRSAKLLHPVLDTLAHKVCTLKTDMRRLYYGGIEETLIREAHRNRGKLERPCGSAKMAKLGHEKMEEAITGLNSHMERLEHALSRLRDQSQEDKLHILEERLTEAGQQLSKAFESTHCREVVGDDNIAGSFSGLMLSTSGLHPLAIEERGRAVSDTCSSSAVTENGHLQSLARPLSKWSWRT